MINVKPLQNEAANHSQQFVQIQDCGGLPGNGIDGLQLLGPASFQGIEAGILQRHRRLRGKQREQINHAGIEVPQPVALKIKHTHYFITNHERNCDLRLSFSNSIDVAGILVDVGRIDWTLQLSGSSSQSFADRYPIADIHVATPEVRLNEKFLFALVQQHHCAVLQLKVIADDGKDLVQDQIG